jgi:hypothetical protein
MRSHASRNVTTRMKDGTLFFRQVTHEEVRMGSAACRPLTSWRYESIIVGMGNL